MSVANDEIILCTNLDAWFQALEDGTFLKEWERERAKVLERRAVDAPASGLILCDASMD